MHELEDISSLFDLPHLNFIMFVIFLDFSKKSILNFPDNAGTNKQHVPTKNSAKLDRETEELKHKAIDTNVARYIQQGRAAKGLSQKDLATKINEKQQIVNDYEAGRGIPNNIILGKMERALGMKLRGKDIGQPLAPPSAKK